jgi:antitoxin component YwqK of YwqJK toxin-antitoxin module
MKKIFLILLMVHGFANNSRSQSIDTVKTYSYGKMPPIYGMDKLYWERNYDDKNHLSFEGLRYNDCFIGAFINYWENGIVKTRGQYLSNTSGDWTNLQDRGLCSIQVGEWKEYDESGKLIRTFYYEKGKMVAAPAIDTVTTVDFGKMPPVYFSNKVYWEKNYNKNNHLVFEALKYNSCYIGAYINYSDNGKVKTRGQYIQNTSGDWTDLKNRGLCSVMDGEWKNYNEAGALISTVIYDKGKIVKEY